MAQLACAVIKLASLVPAHANALTRRAAAKAEIASPDGIIKDLPDHADSPAPQLSTPNVPHGLEVLRTYGDGFAGRKAELAALHEAWDGGVVRIFVLHAQGGAGKTRVVAKWLTELRDAGWRGAGRVFVHSFYSQGNDQHRNASSELFFEQALAHFGHPGPPLTDPTEKGRALARLLIEQHGLLVLDGIEPLQQPPSFDQGRLKDPALQTLLVTLAIGQLGPPAGPGLCVVTSRQPVFELRDKTGGTVLQQPLDRLDAAAGVALLRELEVRGNRELSDAEAAARAWPHPPPPSPIALPPPGEGAPPLVSLIEVLKEPDMSDRSRSTSGFDVFLSHNSKDKPAVREIKTRLLERNVSVWLDEDELRPGISWQEILEDAIRESRSVAVFLGASGVGPWTNEEMRAALDLAVHDKKPVIPVLLPGAPGDVRVPMFLGNRTWVDLRPAVTDQALGRLVWGITGIKPNPSSRPRTTSPAVSSQREDFTRDQVFISYSHRDKKFMEELQTHLKPYLRSGVLAAWSDQQIAPGTQWFDEIQGGLSRTVAAVLLVSPDFLASDFIHDQELGPLLKEAKAGGVRILWVPLRPSAYEKTPLKDYQAVSAPDRPLAQMSKPDRDSAWVEICKKIERAVAGKA
jgi:TIR domain